MEPDHGLRPLLTVKETCRVLGVSKQTVYRLLAAGDLQCVIVGERKRFRPEDLEAYLAGQQA